MHHPRLNRLSRRHLLYGSAALAATAGFQGRAAFPGLAQGTPAPAAAAEQTLRFAQGATSVNLDPHLTYGVSSIGTYTYQIWAGLTKVDGSLNAVPDIATRWDVSADGLQYTFHLDPERTFADGTPITANDVVWSWTRSLDPATESLVAGSYLRDVVGAAEYWQGASTDVPSGYRALDEFTFQVDLKSAKNYFPEVMIHPSTFVVKQADVEAGTDSAPWYTTARGFSGPYAVESYTQGESLELVANPSYPVPHQIQRISYRLVEDAQTQFLLYQNDEVDFTPLSIPDADNIINKDETYRAELIQQAQWWQNNLYFRNQLAPFDDENVRRAFMLAIDEDLLIQTVLNGLNPDIDGIYYPGMDVYKEEVPRIGFDAAAAQQALAESTYGSADALPAIEFYIPADNQTGTEARLAAALQEMWKQNLGVEVQTRVVATYDEMLDSNVQIVIGGEAMHYPDAAGVGYFTCESGANISQFCDPAIDAKYEEAASTTDIALSLKTYQEIEAALMERAAFYPMYQVVAFGVLKPRVKNFRLTDMYTFADFQNVYIAAE